MKIRTENDLQDAIDSELAWCKRELSAVRSNIASARKFAKDTAIRAGIALLYAHWEGSIKNVAAYYLEYVATLKLPYRQLKPNFLAIALKYDLKSFEESNKATVHTNIVRSVIQNQEIKSNIPVEGIIKTNSNLNSEIFVEIMATLGLEHSEYESSFATVYKGNIIKNLIMDCQSYTKYRPNETTGGIFVSWRRKEELPTGA